MVKKKDKKEMKIFIRLLIFLGVVFLFESCITEPEFNNTYDPQNAKGLSIPFLISPTDGATVPTSLTLSWNASSVATSYHLQVSMSGTFGSFVYNQSGLTGTSQQLNGLHTHAKYYWRVSATNSIGTSAWSSPWSFTTLSGGGSSCTGRPTVAYSGKIYNTVQVGSQCWLKENLDVGVYVASINTGSTHSDVSNNGIIEKYCYDNNPAYCDTFGGLYDWNEAMGYVTTAGTQGICPLGWHIPTRAEFLVLEAAVNNDGNALKSIGQGTGGGAGTNTSGFSALLAGYRYETGYFLGLGNTTYFWSSMEYNSGIAYFLNLDYNIRTIYPYGNYKVDGFSVRCVMD